MQVRALPPVAVALIGLILIIMGLPGFYVRQAMKAGVLGLIGWIIFLCSGLLATGAYVTASVFIAIISPSALAGPPPPSILVFFITLTFLTFVGGVLLGIATIRARVFLPWIG